MYNKAFTYATKKHEGQEYNGGAFILHPIEVAYILKTLTDDENLICAGLLHDVIEQCNVTYEELSHEFNEDIASLVREVTKFKYNTFPNLKTRRGVILKFADRLANLYSMDKWDEERQAKYILKSKFWKVEVEM